METLLEVINKTPNARQMFEDWTAKNRIPGSFVYQWEIDSLWGHFLKFFDEQGINISFLCEEGAEQPVVFDFDIMGQEIDYDCLDTRKEAQLSAISKAFEILDKRLA